MRRAARRDRNETPLVSLARHLGWWLTKLDQPCDWLGSFRGKWHAIEIKDPSVEGHANEYTEKQRKWHAEAKDRGARVLIWRTADDVIAASKSSMSA